MNKAAKHIENSMFCKSSHPNLSFHSKNATIINYKGRSLKFQCNFGRMGGNPDILRKRRFENVFAGKIECGDIDFTVSGCKKALSCEAEVQRTGQIVFLRTLSMIYNTG